MLARQYESACEYARALHVVRCKGSPAALPAVDTALSRMQFFYVDMSANKQTSVARSLCPWWTTGMKAKATLSSRGKSTATRRCAPAGERDLETGPGYRGTYAGKRRRLAFRKCSPACSTIAAGSEANRCCRLPRPAPTSDDVACWLRTAARARWIVRKES